MNGILLCVAASFFAAVVLDAPVSWAERRGAPRAASATLAVALLLAAAGAAIWMLARPVSRIYSDVPRYATKIKAVAAAVDRQLLKIERRTALVQAPRPAEERNAPRV